MARQPSSIDRLPDELKEAIGKLRVQGRTIDEILAHLKTLDVEISRSALGRHVKRLETLRERMRTSRDLALALTEKYGEQPENRVAQVNLEMMHSVLLQLLTAAQENEDGEMVPVTFDPESVMFMARSLKDLASAQKTDSDRILVIRKEIAREQSKKLEAAGRAGEIDADAIAKAKRILGFDA